MKTPIILLTLSLSALSIASAASASDKPEYPGMVYIQPSSVDYLGGFYRLGVTQGFWISDHEVTQAEFYAINGERPSKNVSPNHPVENVSFRQITRFINSLNRRNEDHGSPWRYGLPTLSQWLVAASDVYANPAAHCNVTPKTSDVMTGTPNQYGLYNLGDNVSELLLDKMIVTDQHIPGGIYIDYVFAPSWKDSQTVRFGRNGGEVPGMAYRFPFGVNRLPAMLQTFLKLNHVVCSGSTGVLATASGQRLDTESPTVGFRLIAHKISLPSEAK